QSEVTAGIRRFITRPARASSRADLRQHRVRRAQSRLSAIRGERTTGAHRVGGTDRGRLQGRARRHRSRLRRFQDPPMSPRREIIVPAVHAPDTASSFGQAVSTVVRGGDFLFVRGLTAVDPQSGERVRGTTASETRQILTHLKQLLEAAGSSLERVVKVNVWLHSMLEAPNMNEVYA